jgi:DNA-binding MarR family transcriptional regulator
MKEDLFVRPKPIQILFELFGNENKIIHDINKKTDITYSHISGILKLFRENGLISMEKKGRQVLLNLTTRGYEIVYKLKEIQRLAKEGENANKN